MKKIYLIFLLSFTCSLSFSQINVNVPSVGCPINTYSTNPNSYNNQVDPNNLKKWDWMTEDFEVYYQIPGQGTAGFSTIIRSPFFELISNSNTQHFIDQIQKDFSPESGWELLYHNFGSPTQGIKNPYFMLYNRITGVIRAFANIKNSGNQSVNLATLTLSFHNKRRTAIFNQMGSISNGVNNFEAKARGIVNNRYVNSGINDNFYWLWADYYTHYDPCTCGLESDLIFVVSLITDTQVELSVNGVNTTVVNTTGGNNSIPSETPFTGLKQYLDFGTGIVQDVGGAFSSANQSFNQGVQLQTDANNFVLNNEELFGSENTGEIISILGNLLYEVPKVASWMGLASNLITTIPKIVGGFNSLTAGEKLEAINNTTSITTINTKLKVSGNLIQSSVFLEEIMALPGSVQTGLPPYRKPVYDNVLGVFNLMEQPLITLSEYKAPSELILSYGGIWENNSTWDVFPKIYHAKVMNELKPVVNPASGLKIVSFESRVEYINREGLAHQFKGPFMPGKLKTFFQFDFLDVTIFDRQSYYESIGYDVLLFDKSNFNTSYKWDKALISTPYFNQGCFTSTNLFSFSKPEKINVKVNVVLEPINPNSKHEKVLLSYTYPAKLINKYPLEPYIIENTIDNVVYHKDFSALDLGITIPGVTPTTINTGGTIFLQDLVISSNMDYVGNVIVGNNVKLAEGNFSINVKGNISFVHSPILMPMSGPIDPNNFNITFNSTKEIAVLPNVIIEPNLILKIDPTIKIGCENVSVNSPSSAEIASYCNSNAYNTLSQAQKDNDSINDINFTQDFKNEEILFVMFPNPTSGLVSIKFNISIDDLEVKVYDITGRESKIVITSLGHLSSFDAAHLSKGIYQVKLESKSFGSRVKQLIIN